MKPSSALAALLALLVPAALCQRVGSYEEELLRRQQQQLYQQQLRQKQAQQQQTQAYQQAYAEQVQQQAMLRQAQQEALRAQAQASMGSGSSYGQYESLSSKPVSKKEKKEQEKRKKEIQKKQAEAAKQQKKLAESRQKAWQQAQKQAGKRMGSSRSAISAKRSNGPLGLFSFKGVLLVGTTGYLYLCKRELLFGVVGAILKYPLAMLRWTLRAVLRKVISVKPSGGSLGGELPGGTY